MRKQNDFFFGLFLILSLKKKQGNSKNSGYPLYINFKVVNILIYGLSPSNKVVTDNNVSSILINFLIIFFFGRERSSLCCPKKKRGIKLYKSTIYLRDSL